MVHTLCYTYIGKWVSVASHRAFYVSKLLRKCIQHTAEWMILNILLYIHYTLSKQCAFRMVSCWSNMVNIYWFFCCCSNVWWQAGWNTICFESWLNIDEWNVAPEWSVRKCAIYVHISNYCWTTATKWNFEHFIAIYTHLRAVRGTGTGRRMNAHTDIIQSFFF